MILTSNRGFDPGGARSAMSTSLSKARLGGTYGEVTSLIAESGSV